MKLYYDNIIFSLQEIGGVSTYWYELLSRALIEDSIDLCVLESRLANQNLLRSILKIDSLRLKSSNSNLLSRILPLRISSHDNFVFHSSYYRYVKNPKAKVITTVHDFIQEYTNPGFVNLNSIMKKKAINNSDIIIAISENTKCDILKFHPKIDESKIVVIHNGVSNDFFQLENVVRSNYTSVLYVGSRADYKNFAFTVNVISKFDNLRLDIVGNALNKVEIAMLKSLLRPSRWKLYTRLSNIELNELYNKSGCLIYPSNYEGFGIPVVEAMKAGCPVIALNKSSVPEIAGNAALLVDTTSIADFYDGINLILNDREAFVSNGIKNASRFSWDKTYTKTFNLYK
jgi:mannosyltransferase